MSPILTLVIGLVALVLYFSAFWLLQRAINNAAVVDVGWAMSVAGGCVLLCGFWR